VQPLLPKRSHQG